MNVAHTNRSPANPATATSEVYPEVNRQVHPRACAVPRIKIEVLIRSKTID